MNLIFFVFRNIAHITDRRKKNYSYLSEITFRGPQGEALSRGSFVWSDTSYHDSFISKRDAPFPDSFVCSNTDGH